MVRRDREILLGFGRDARGCKNDIYKAVFEKECAKVIWSKIKFINTGPSPREKMANATLANGDLFIHGGIDNFDETLRDTWKLKFTSN